MPRRSYNRVVAAIGHFQTVDETKHTQQPTTQHDGAWVSCVESWLVVFSGFPGEMSLKESAKNYPLDTESVVSSDYRMWRVWVHNPRECGPFVKLR